MATSRARPPCRARFVDVEGAVQASPCPLGSVPAGVPADGVSHRRDQLLRRPGRSHPVDDLPGPHPDGPAGATSPADCVPEAVETGVCTAGIGSLDYDPGILLGDPDGPVAQQTTVTMELSGCTSSAVAGSFTGTYTGSGDTVPLYVNGETDNSFLTLPIGTTVSVDSGSIAWSDGATSQAESELVLVADPVVGRAYELRWSITSGRFSGTSPVGSLGTADILDVPTLAYTGAELTLGAVVFVPLGGCAAPAAPNVDWRNCDKTAADLSGANLSGAILSGANLASADLSGADLSGSGPVRRHPVGGRPVRCGPVRRRPVVRQSVRRQPDRRGPVRRQPGLCRPVRRQPGLGQPVRRRRRAVRRPGHLRLHVLPRWDRSYVTGDLRLHSNSLARRAYVDATGAAAATPEPTGCTSTVSVGEVAPGSRCRPLRGRDGGGWPEGTWSRRHRGDRPGLSGVGPRRGLAAFWDGAHV